MVKLWLTQFNLHYPLKGKLMSTFKNSLFNSTNTIPYLIQAEIIKLHLISS